MSFLLAIAHLDFGCDSAAGELFHDLTVQFPTGWSGVVGANGSGKTTLLRLLTGALPPDGGTVRRIGACALCAQETGAPPDGLDALFSSRDRYAFHLRERLKLTADQPARWHSLSEGERKKLQIAAALFRCPGILCLDEPTNHLDAASRRQLESELRDFRGIGVLVSHDRALLDALCERCLFLGPEPGRAVLHAGGVTVGMAEEKQARSTALRQWKQVQGELDRRKQELQRRRQKQEEARNRDAKRKAGKRDFDAREKIDRARVSGRDRSQNDLAGRQARSVERTAARLAATERPRELQPGLRIPYGRYARQDLLLDLPEQALPLAPGRRLLLPALRLAPRDRVGVKGANGSGKSTLLRHLVRELKLPPAGLLYLPQEFTPADTAAIRERLRTLPRDAYSKVMNVVASLGSTPERVLAAEHCSPGEWRKLFFGLGVLGEISLIVMDEPTNHLDLPSIECLEAALPDCRCALLLVSHDRRFLDRLCPIHWETRAAGGGDSVLVKRL